MAYNHTSHSKHNTSAWESFICVYAASSKWQNILVWFSNAFLEQWDAAMLCVYLPLFIKETNPHTQQLTRTWQLSFTTCSCCHSNRVHRAKTLNGTLGLKLLFLFQMQVFYDEKGTKVWGLQVSCQLKL